MNLELFNNLMGEKPFQYYPEWWMFLSICEIYLKRYEIEKPIVVEIGSWMNRQKKFYEQLLNAEHIGIDISDKSGAPDILGDSQDPKTLEMLKERLGGRVINILFIDALHHYGAVKRDYNMYSPLCEDIVAFHDIESSRYHKSKKTRVWKFWDELKLKVHEGDKGYRDSLLLSIHEHREANQGIGVLIKRKIEWT